jgi:hypothetical protein
MQLSLVHASYTYSNDIHIQHCHHLYHDAVTAQDYIYVALNH